MAKTVIPIKSSDLITQLLQRFPDKLDVYEDISSPFERGKKAGVVELLRELQSNLKGETVKKTAKV